MDLDRALDPHSRVELQPTTRQFVCRNIGRECMHLLFLLRGPKSKAIARWPSFWRSAFDVVRVRCGDSLYNWRTDDLPVFFCDWWYTILDQLLKPRA